MIPILLLFVYSFPPEDIWTARLQWIIIMLIFIHLDKLMQS